jgi:streptomycin 6-kinase
VSVDLTRARRTAEQVAREWGLPLGAPFALSNYSSVAPVGEHAVLKVAWEGDDESLHEDAALALWDGDGAVRLHRADRSRRALLEERAVPGTDIADLDDDEATQVAISVAQRLWRRAGEPFRPVVDVVPRWLESGPGPLTARARELLARLGPGGGWLVHGDLHHHNILRHGGGFVAIDPKPYLADREYDVYSWLVNPLPYQIDRQTSERRIGMFVGAGLDEWRIRAWAIVRGAYLADEEEQSVLGTLL